MMTELQALQGNNTWILVPKLVGRKIVGSKWVYKVKFRSNGEVERYKARLVVRGYTQREGLYYNETFSPVAKLVSVRTLLAIAFVTDWHLCQMDVNNAFLHGDLEEEIYMVPPQGLLPEGDPRVCRLHKSLYGLKQASRNWIHKLSSSLFTLGFLQSKVEPTLFYLRTVSSYTCVLIYVDDLVIAGDDLPAIASLKDHLRSLFHIKDLGNLKYFLGIEVSSSA